MVADKENTYHKTQKGKPKPKTETQIPKRKHKNQNQKIQNRIMKQFQKNWKFSLMPVIQNTQNPEIDVQNPKKKHTSKIENPKPETER